MLIKHRTPINIYIYFWLLIIGVGATTAVLNAQTNTLGIILDSVNVVLDDVTFEPVEQTMIVRNLDPFQTDLANYIIRINENVYGFGSTMIPAGGTLTLRITPEVNIAAVLDDGFVLELLYKQGDEEALVGFFDAGDIMVELTTVPTAIPTATPTATSTPIPSATAVIVIQTPTATTTAVIVPPTTTTPTITPTATIYVTPIPSTTAVIVTQTPVPSTTAVIVTQTPIPSTTAFIVTQTPIPVETHIPGQQTAVSLTAAGSTYVNPERTITLLVMVLITVSGCIVVQKSVFERSRDYTS